MRRFVLLVLAGTVVGTVLIAAACSTPTEPPPEDKPTFAPGEYGGEPLPGTEHITIVEPSPSGDRFALIRKRTPGDLSDPRFQLWIVDRNGSNPRLISVNTHDVDWHPSGTRLVVTVARGIDFYVYTIDLETMETTQWTGKDDQRLSFPVVSMAGWFQDGNRILVFANQKAYQQRFREGCMSSILGIQQRRVHWSNYFRQLVSEITTGIPSARSTFVVITRAVETLRAMIFPMALGIG